MNDAWTGEEARALWQRMQNTENEAAAYREVFANPEDARAIKALYPGGVAEAQAVAQRARMLDEIDRAYFAPQAGTPEQARASRAQLAAMMLREDPAAFREMVYEGLRVLEAAQGSGSRSIADAFGRTSPTQSIAAQATISPAAQLARATQTGPPAMPPEHLAAYSAFEKTANAELEKSVGGAIDRALHQALPNIDAADRSSSVVAQHAAPLQARLSQAIREDVERALQNDRQLGEQVAQILASRRLDDAARAKVVRLINDRALQLVPNAAKRALNEWTQATLAAHRSRTTRSEAANSRREVTTAAASPRDLRPGTPSAPSHLNERNTRAPANTKSRVNYHKLSDDQILDM